ncbi:MAG: cytidine deaminase, partial [Desulfitobacteriaceae bacterium]
MSENKIRNELISQARQASEQAYAPYSHYPVGAAAYFSSGKIYTGCNV